MAGKTCSCQKHKVSGMKSIKGYPVERLAMVAAGAVGAEFAVNTLVDNLTKNGKMEFLKKKGVPSAIKIVAGLGLLSSKSKQAQDAGLGALAAGGLGLARAFLKIPSDINGIYSQADNVGTVIDLDQVSGPMSPDEYYDAEFA